MTENELVIAMAVVGAPMLSADDLTTAELLTEHLPQAVPAVTRWIRRAHIAGLVAADTDRTN
ncbi:hypothetical protein [Promicromonospora sp. NPDC057488]|uniref:hypothetical protein n=1 Tax=Promicromonospora sp. NPDC057488 TaxID=3346147 RepID=UPI00366CB61D